MHGVGRGRWPRQGCLSCSAKRTRFSIYLGTEHFEAFLQNWLVAFKLLEPFCIKIGVMTQEEFDQLYERLQLEMLLDDFRGIMFLLTVWGEKATE